MNVAEQPLEDETRGAATVSTVALRVRARVSVSVRVRGAATFSTVAVSSMPVHALWGASLCFSASLAFTFLVRSRGRRPTSTRLLLPCAVRRLHLWSSPAEMHICRRVLIRLGLASICMREAPPSPTRFPAFAGFEEGEQLDRDQPYRRGMERRCLRPVLRSSGLYVARYVLPEQGCVC